MTLPDDLEQRIRALAADPALQARVEQAKRQLEEGGDDVAGVDRAGLYATVADFEMLDGRPDSAVEWLRRGAAEPDAPAELRFHLARALLQAQRNEEAADLLQELWQLRPRDLAGHEALGATFMAAGLDREAIRWLTAGALAALRTDRADPVAVARLLRLRRAARLRQGFVEDDYDRMAAGSSEQ
ncbi:tetratricopeptide repeat protein [Motilibacter aurantiacus]|uniref:tetratricopeptide repeat protein n=1 Tax=Motilibacter aurantiacus TaxID=2714955 RepID=UPI00140CB62A|nr:tetratricopeptide repeat protein [Motilibacter aurantiacus]NHC46590.1 tetratricopeptide repeat protein [Motilibacter aurantiacus]